MDVMPITDNRLRLQRALLAAVEGFHAVCGKRGTNVAQVICTGVHHSLMETRRMILEKAGHSVVPAMSVTDVEHACSKHVFEVAVIGQSVTEPEKHQISELVRLHCPTAKILELHTITGRILNDADDWLLVPADVPSDLAERVTSLAAKTNKS